MPPKTIFEKIWDDHVVAQAPDEPAVIYIDLHLVHEVTSPQAFEGLREAGRKVRRLDLTVATADHNTPTWDLALQVTCGSISDASSSTSLSYLAPGSVVKAFHRSTAASKSAP